LGTICSVADGTVGAGMEDIVDDVGMEGAVGTPASVGVA